MTPSKLETLLPGLTIIKKIQRNLAHFDAKNTSYNNPDLLLFTTFIYGPSVVLALECAIYMRHLS